MSTGLRAKAIIYSFPFYERDRPSSEAEEKAEHVIRILNRVPFIKRAWLDTDKLREPLYIEVDPNHHKLQNRSIGTIEKGLEKLLLKMYNFRQCL